MTGFLEGTEKQLVGREKIEKVTGSQDDAFLEGLKTSGGCKKREKIEKSQAPK